MLSEFCESLTIHELEIITFIEGIGNTTGATFLAEIGGIRKFSSHKSLIAYAGLILQSINSENLRAQVESPKEATDTSEELSIL